MKRYVVRFIYEIELDDFDSKQEAMEFAKCLVHDYQMLEVEYDRIEMDELD